MPKIILLAISFALVLGIQAQPPLPAPPAGAYPKTITVDGSAEMNIVPDEIYVNIELKEYQKKGEAKRDIETIKSQFLDYCKDAQIPDSAISILSYSGYANYFQFKRKKLTEMNASITYQVKFNNSKMIDNLVSRLDDAATESFIISHTSHSNIAEFRKQLKIKALQAAKAKAVYLAESIGEKAGDAINITEPSENVKATNYGYANQVVSNIAMSNVKYSSGKIVSEVDFKKLHLRYEVNAVFALK